MGIRGDVVFAIAPPGVLVAHRVRRRMMAASKRHLAPNALSGGALSMPAIHPDNKEGDNAFSCAGWSFAICESAIYYSFATFSPVLPFTAAFSLARSCVLLAVRIHAIRQADIQEHHIGRLARALITRTTSSRRRQYEVSARRDGDVSAVKDICATHVFFQHIFGALA